MSFTSTVKDEVSKINISDTESISELSAIVQSTSEITDKLLISTENNSVARRIYNLFKSVFNVYPKITVRRGYNYNKKMIYILEVKNDILPIFKKLGFESVIPSDFVIADDELTRAYLRGLFMVSGSINDPKTSRYHLEFNLNDESYAEFICFLLNKYDLNCKILHRDNRYMVYIKEAEKIGDFLRMIGAYNAVMYFEDIRIYRDHKNMTNRLNNCEQANVDRIIETSNNQINDIELIKKEGLMDVLDDKEKEVCEYRVKYTDASLGELAEIITLETGNKITKSGLYHRFKKIKNMADKIRNRD